MNTARLWQFPLIFAVLLAVAGCTAPDGAGGVNDPYEASNREYHDFNKSLDRNLLRPTANTYGTVVPEPIRESVSNFAGNTGLPSAIVNNVLQADLGGAAQNTVRFVVNTTIGIGGLFDPATALGVDEVSADFEGTLAAWGLPEGAYMELPVLGPSTERHTAGRLVDLFLDPLGNVGGQNEAIALRTTRVAGGLNSRYRFGETVDSILYDSADSYAQSRLIYLQNRRFELGTESEDDYFDPYEDPYDE